MTTPNPSELFSPFLPTTYNIPEDDDRLKIFLLDKFANFADVINDKKIGTITQAAENFNGDTFFYKTTQITRNGYQTLAYIPSFVNGLTLTLTSSPQYPIPAVNPELVVSLVYGSASKPCSKVGAGDGDYFSFMAKGDTRISFTLSDTQIIITTDGARASYSGFIIINYLRNGV